MADMDVIGRNAVVKRKNVRFYCIRELCNF